MRKNSITCAALGIAAVGLTLVGCGLGEPSNAQIESSLRQPLLAQLKEDGAPQSYLEVLQKNMKITVVKNDGCKPTVERTYECDVSIELDLPEYNHGNGTPKVDAEKLTGDIKAKYIMTPNGWEAQLIAVRDFK